MNIRRIRQVIKYAAIHSKIIKEKENAKKVYRAGIYLDMVICFLKYRMWTNQYLQENFHKKAKEERRRIGLVYLLKGIERDRWQKDFIENRRFLNKYTRKIYDLPQYKMKRNEAYRKRYKMGENCIIESDVELVRQHYMPDIIRIGKNVVLASQVYIDYSGTVVIEDNIGISRGVQIFSHSHSVNKSGSKDRRSIIFQKEITLKQGCWIGAGAIILEDTREIGVNSVVAAGAVVTKPVPDNVVVAGNPAKIVKQLH